SLYRYILSIPRHPFRFQYFYHVYQAVFLYHEIETSDYPPRFGLGDFNSKGNFTCFLFLCRKKPQENIKKVLGMSIEKREEFDHREINTVLDHKSNDNALLKLIKRNTCHKTIKRISCK